MSARARNEVAGTTQGVAEQESLLREGHNAWKVVRAERYALLLDAQEYYRRLRASLLAARRDVFLLGWDFDLHLELVRGEDVQDDAPTSLRELLNHIVSQRRGLRVYVLPWDFSSLFAFDRQPLMVLHIGLRLHRHVAVEFDAKHPIGAAHHQKIVVIDDALAYVGGLDLTNRRWDTDCHQAEDPLRCEPDGKAYPPYHDVQTVVTGEAARAMAQLARARWKRASRKRLRRPQPGDARHLWPAGLEPDLVDVRVGIARTRPDFGGESAVREVERLHMDCIARARHTIYMESQYFTSPAITAALAQRLAEPDGPEVVLVLPRARNGWIEEWALGSLMYVSLGILGKADAHGRLRALFALASRSKDVPVFIHAKVTCYDDRWLRVGSANLSKRSMGIDTECDLLVEAESAEERQTVRRLRGRMVAHFLGVPEVELSAAIEEEGCLRGAIDRYAGRERGFDPIEHAEVEITEAMHLADLDEPIEPTRLIDRFMPELSRVGSTRGRGPVGLLVGTVVLVTALTLLWRLTPLSGAFSLEGLDALRNWGDEGEHGLLAAVGVFIVAPLLMLPLNLLILATVLLFGGPVGVLFSLVGSVVAAFVHFNLGGLLGRRQVAHLVGPRVNRLSAKLVGGGVSSVTAVRLLPVAPFAVVNLACGASRISLREYGLGTLIGLLPGIVGMALFAWQVRNVLESPGPMQVTILILIAVLVVFLAWLLQRFLRDHELGTVRAGEGA